MATTTLYAISESGRIQSDSTVYATARAGNSLTLDIDTIYLRVGQDFNGVDYVIWETLIRFDLASLSGTINSAVLGLASEETNDSTTDFNIKARDYAYGATMETGDWVAGASLDSTGTLRAHWSSSSYAAYTSYNDFTNDAMPALVEANIGDTIELLLYSDRHAAGNTPTNPEFLYFMGIGTAHPPRLVIDYTPPSSPASAPSGQSLASLTSLSSLKSL